MKALLSAVLIGSLVVGASANSYSNSIKGAGYIGDAYGAYENIENGNYEELAKGVASVAVGVGVEAVSVPATVSIVSATGATASTGTAISTLSGAAATSSTLAYVGSGVASVIGATTGIVLAPAVVGGAIVVGVGAAISYGITSLFD